MPKLILVADDDRDIVSLIVQALRDEGFEVESTHGRRTLELIEQRKPDVVLLDYQMPGMNGIEIARQIRALPDYEGVRIIAMTAATHASLVCREMGAHGCLGKPFDIDDLIDVVEQPEHSTHAA